MPFKDPAKATEYKHNYQITHREKINAYNRKYYAEHLEEERERSRKDNIKYREYSQKWHKDRDDKLRRDVLEILGNKCCHCGFSDPRALQVDHVNGGGGKEFRALGKTKMAKKVLETNGEGYQLLCANCNWIKRYENKECSVKGSDLLVIIDQIEAIDKELVKRFLNSP